MRNFLARCRWPFFALIVVVFFSMGHFAGAVQKEQEILKAKSIVAGKFELRSPEGKETASLFSGPKGETLLSFFDRGGNPRMIMGLDPKGSPIISLANGKGAPRLIISLDQADGMPEIALLDDRGEPAINIGTTKGLGSAISLGKPGQARISIDVSEQGSPSIRLWDQKNNPRISLALHDDSPSILLLGANRDVRLTWRVLPDGSPAFSLSDGQSRVRLAVTIDKNGKPSIRFIDPEKNEDRELR